MNEFRHILLPTHLTEMNVSMEVTYASLDTHDKLHQHVHQVLCQRDRLDMSQTPLRRSLLIRSGKNCGLFFQVDGPRMHRNHAVWAGQENRILFYDSLGNRFAETRLIESPDPLNLPD